MNHKRIDATNTDSWQLIGPVSVGRSIRKGRTYTYRNCHFPYQSISQPGGEVKPGEYITYLEGDRPVLAQYIGAVTAEADGPTVPAFVGFAVVYFSVETAGLYERWIDRREIVRVIDARPYLQLLGGE
jgi:hypothetical protein